MEGGALLRSGQAKFLRGKSGPVKPGRRCFPGSLFRRLLIQIPPLQLGSRQLGRQLHIPQIRIFPEKAILQPLRHLLLRHGLPAVGSRPAAKHIPLHPPQIPGQAKIHLRRHRGLGVSPAQDLPLRPGQNGQQHPLGHAGTVQQCLRLHRRSGHGHQLLDIPLSPRQSAGQYQLLLGPGHGDIKKPQLLRHHLPVHLPGHRPAGQGGILYHSLRVQSLWPHPQPGMKQHGLGLIGAVELPGHAREKHHRKLQPLGPVDAHDAHPARPLLLPLDRGIFLLLQPLEVCEKVKQALMAPLLKLPGQLGQQKQIAPPHLPFIQSGIQPQQVRPVVKLPQQPVAARIPRLTAQPGQFRQKGLHILSLIQRKSGIKILLWRIKANLGQPVGRERIDRRPQYGNKGHILPGVINDFQQ